MADASVHTVRLRRWRQPRGDTTKTSLDHVQHQDTSTDLWVEPEDGDRCDIVAYWNTNLAVCQEDTETASVHINWDGGSRQLDDVSLSPNIAAIDLCADDTCSSGEEIHSWGYWFILTDYGRFNYSRCPNRRDDTSFPLGTNYCG